DSTSSTGSTGGATGSTGSAGSTDSTGSTGTGSSGSGDAMGFAITSPSFNDGEMIPYEFTCEGKPFGDGTSPELHWTPGPSGTQSYAIVFKDTSLTTQQPPDDHGYHWAMWDIPVDTSSLPAGMGADQFPASPAGSQQYSGYPGRPFQFLGPC